MEYGLRVKCYLTRALTMAAGAPLGRYGYGHDICVDEFQPRLQDEKSVWLDHLLRRALPVRIRTTDHACQA
jgi:hypothetical protein